MKIIRIIIIAILIVASFALINWAIHPNSSPNWTGFGKYDENKQGPRAKSLWDWLDLLIIPFAIGIVAWSFKEAEKEKSNKNEEERAQNDVLDSFIKIMTDLITNYSLANSKSTLETKIIARTRINLALNRLNAIRKGQVIQFLFESGLIDQNPQIKLLGGNIKDALLDGIVLSEAEIKGAYFNNASIKCSNLNRAIFTSSNFTSADLSNSLVENTDFSYTNLTKTKLKGMDLRSANFEGANLTKADLRGSQIKREQLNDIINKQGIKLSKSKIQ
jgi:uncharacterized protein YjbI with pentapeptide repeats